MNDSVSNNPMLDRDEAIEAYIAERRRRVDAFAQSTFSVAGTLRTLRRTFLKDIIKYPINFFLAVPSLVVKTTAEWLDMLGWDHLARFVAKVPLPLATAFQQAIEDRVINDLLELPHGVARDSATAPLQAYRAKRLTILDGGNSGISLLAAYIVFGDTGISPYAMGDRLAREQARRESTSSFIFGRSAGSVFYNVFPPHPSFTQICLATSGVLLALSVLSVLTSLIADPLQQAAGTHKRQLSRLLDSLEERLLLQAHKARRDASATVPSLPTPTTQPSVESHVEPRVEPAVASPRVFPVIWSTCAGVSRRSVKHVTEIYKTNETKYGRRPTIAALLATVLLASFCVSALANRLRYDPYRETRELVAAKAYPTALAHLDALPHQNTQQKLGIYWYLRGRALIGTHAYDAGTDAYRAAIQRDAAYRDDATLIEDLVGAVAKGSNTKARLLLLTENGPRAIPTLRRASLAKEKIDRWTLVETAEKLGGGDQLDYEDIAREDLEQAISCADNKRALQKIDERHIAIPRSTLQRLDQPQLRCLQPMLKTMLDAREGH